MKSFKTIRESRKSARYQDAMMSRLPAHLDDPRLDDEEKPKPKSKMVQGGNDRGSAQALKSIKESTWELYRETALLESVLDKPTSSPDVIAKKHGVTVDHINAQLKKGIGVEHEHTTDTKIAREIALDHLGEDPDYYTKLDKAHLEEGARQERYEAETAAIRENKKKPENQKEHAFKAAGFTHPNGHPRCIRCGDEESTDGKCKPSLQEELTPRERISTTDRLKPKEKPPVDRAADQKKEVKKSLYTTKQGTFSYKKFREDRRNQPHKFIAGVQEEYNVAFNESGAGAYKVGDKVIAKMGPHKGQVHTVIHVHDTGHLNIKPDVHPKSNRYHLGAARAHPEQVERAPLKESSTKRTFYANKQQRDPAKWLKNRGKQFKHWSDEIHTTNVNPLRKKTVQEGTSEGMTFHDAVDHAKKHGNKVTFGTASRKWHSIDSSDRDYHTSFALHPDEARQYGLAKSLLLSTSARHVREETTTGINRLTVQEAFKAAKAKTKSSPYTSSEDEVLDSQIRQDDKAYAKERKLQKKSRVASKGSSYTRSFRKALDSSLGLQEAFKAAKAKKDALPTDGAKEPNKDIQAPKPTPGDSQVGGNPNPPQGFPAAGGEKKSNTPKPEARTKGEKLTVKGPGPDDKFQTNPVVTTLTQMPDMGSPKSGSQGAR